MAYGFIPFLLAQVALWNVTGDSRFAQIGTLRLHYVDWNGKGDALIFIPGGCDTAFVFGDVATRLAARFRVLGLTARGCGQSDRPASGYGMDHQVADILGFMDAQSIQRATLIGHSSGAGKITQFARKYPARVNRLVYLDPVYRYVALGLEEKIGAGITASLGGSRLDSLERWKQEARSWELGAWSPAMDRHLGEILAAGPDGRVRYKNPTPPAWRKEVTGDMKAGLYFETRIAHPALAIFAMDTDRDRIQRLDHGARKDLRPLVVDTERHRREEIAAFRANGQHVQVVELRHAAHYVFVERPDEIARLITAFLARGAKP